MVRLDHELVQVFNINHSYYAAIDLFCVELQIVSQVVEWRRLLEADYNHFLHKLHAFLLDLISCYHPSSFSVVYLLIDRSKIYFSQYNTLLEIFCACTEISEANIGVLAAFPASFCLLFLQGSDIF